MAEREPGRRRTAIAAALVLAAIVVATLALLRFAGEPERAAAKPASAPEPPTVATAPPPPVAVEARPAEPARIEAPAVDAPSSEQRMPVEARSSELPPLGVPVDGIAVMALRDTFDDGRSDGRRHEAIDIAAPRGTRVVAADDGVVVKLFTSVPGGLTVYQFDPQSRFAYYYAHLDRYAEGLREGMAVRRGDLIGYVGVTGNAPPDAPHLHFAVFRLGPERQWWKGQPVNPFGSFR